MLAATGHSDAAAAETLPAIVAETANEFSALETKLSQLSERVAGILSAVEHERASIEHFINAFALENEMKQGHPALQEAGTGPLIDFNQIQQERGSLEQRASQARTIRSSLEATLQVIRECKASFLDERPHESSSGTDDVRLRQAMNEAREEERRRLAREIHDGPAQVLANAIFVVGIADQVVKRDPDKVSEQLSDLKGLLRDGVAEIRRFMFDLRPSMLEDQGLGPTLRYYVGEYSRMFAKRVTLEMREPLPPLSEEQELCIFRIVQEGLQNIQKHAETDEAAITLEVVADDGEPGHFLSLTISDRGRGFNAARVEPRQGHGAGLPGMRERARLVGSDLVVESRPGEGTTVRLAIPLRGQSGGLELREPASAEGNRGTT